MTEVVVEIKFKGNTYKYSAHYTLTPISFSRYLEKVRELSEELAKDVEKYIEFGKKARAEKWDKLPLKKYPDIMIGWIPHTSLLGMLVDAAMLSGFWRSYFDCLELRTERDVEKFIEMLRFLNDGVEADGEPQIIIDFDSKKVATADYYLWDEVYEAYGFTVQHLEV